MGFPTKYSSPRFTDWRLWCLLVAFVSAMSTFMSPLVFLKRDYFRYLFVFDITQSMYVRDTGGADEPVTRLTHAKQAALESLQTLPCGSELGAAIFTQHRTFLLFAPVEICAHFGELSRVLEDINSQMAWRSRSEVSKGIHSAIRIVNEFEEPPKLVFFTDGHEAPPINPDFRPGFDTDAGEINGAIVGVGGRTPTPIPKLDSNGVVRGVWKAQEVMQIDVYSLGRVTGAGVEPMVGVDNANLATRIKAGKEHLSSLREPYLKQLASERMLHYQRLETSGQLAEFLTEQRFAGEKLVETDMRWLLGLLALILILLVHLPETFITRLSRVSRHK